jgi:DNA-directed RNA polymerase specialized sigma24 family protein
VKQVPTIAEVLESLPEEERFILTLHLLKAMSPQAIATALDVPTKSVETVISRGKARLITLLDFPPSA